MTIVFLVIGVVVAGCTVSVARDVWVIRRELLPDIRKVLLTLQRASPVSSSPISGPVHDMHSSFQMRNGFFAVWEWCEGEWLFRRDLGPTGLYPGLPPSYPGAFDGDKVKTWVEGERTDGPVAASAGAL